MNSLANTTWTFSTQGQQAGTIYFQQVGPSLHAGVATITPTNPPPAEQGTNYQAAWAESTDGSSNFAVQLSNFETSADGFNPPPLGIPIITEGGGGDPAQFVILFGTHSNGKATMYGTNFQTQIKPSGHIVGSFTMTKQNS